MTRKAKRRKISEQVRACKQGQAEATQTASPSGIKAQGTGGILPGVQEPKWQASASASDLPDTALLLTFKMLEVDRLRAAQVCKRWLEMANDPRFSVEVESGASIIAAIEACPSGGTITISPGYYLVDMILVDKPLKLQAGEGNGQCGARRKVVLQGSRSVIALCNARSCWKGLTLRTANTANCGLLVFGPSCLSLTCRSCEFGGHNGLCLPPDEKLTRSLLLEDCHIHDIRGSAAIMAYSGHLVLQGCQITNCDTAVSVLVGAKANIQNNDISFNGTAFSIDGEGVVENNILWGNFRDESPNAMHDVVIQGLGVATPHPAAGGRQRRAKKRTAEQGRRDHELVVTGNDVKPFFAIPAPGQDGPALQPRVVQLYKHAFGADRTSSYYWRLVGLEDLSDDEEDFSVASSDLEGSEDETGSSSGWSSFAGSDSEDSGALPAGSEELAMWDEDVSFHGSDVADELEQDDSDGSSSASSVAEESSSDDDSD